MSTTPRLAMFSQVLGSSFAAVALFGFLWMNFSGPGGLIALFAIVSAAMLAGAWWKGEAILALLCSIRRVLPSASPGVWLCGVILLGTALRIWIIVLFPATPMQNWNGDMVSYWDLAHKLVNGEDYASPAGRAYWPPGLPFVVA